MCTNQDNLTLFTFFYYLLFKKAKIVGMWYVGWYACCTSSESQYKLAAWHPILIEACMVVPDLCGVRVTCVEYV